MALSAHPTRSLLTNAGCLFSILHSRHYRCISLLILWMFPPLYKIPSFVGVLTNKLLLNHHIPFPCRCPHRQALFVFPSFVGTLTNKLSFNHHSLSLLVSSPTSFVCPFRPLLVSSPTNYCLTIILFPCQCPHQQVSFPTKF